MTDAEETLVLRVGHGDADAVGQLQRLPRG
jgi:hypothetical protein